MTTIQTEATAIVHAGLADVLAWLGETPVTAHQPRHAVRRPRRLTVQQMREADPQVIHPHPIYLAGDES